MGESDGDVFFSLEDDDPKPSSKSPEVLTQLGGPGRFDIDPDGDSLTISRADEKDPDDDTTPVNLILAAVCPACKYVYTDETQECPSCGSSRPMVPV